MKYSLEAGGKRVRPNLVSVSYTHLRNIEPPIAMMESAKTHKVSILRSAETTSQVTAALFQYLNKDVYKRQMDTPTGASVVIVNAFVFVIFWLIEVINTRVRKHN